MTTTTLTTCNECGKELRLPHEDEQHEPLEVDQKLAEKLAGLMVCDDCSAGFERDKQKRENVVDAERKVRASGLPPALHGLQWRDLVREGKREAAIVAAINWANAAPKEARGLYLWGPSGTGKTRVAATAAWHRMTAGGHSLRWVSVAVLLARLEGSFSDNDRQRLVGLLTGDGPIVLDDIDKVNPSEDKRAKLFAAIDTRVVAGVPMLITGNLSPAKLESKLGEAIASRLLGYCLGRTFQMDGPDRRMNLGI
jgi:DNA replication protein DnaC